MTDAAVDTPAGGPPRPPRDAAGAEPAGAGGRRALVRGGLVLAGTAAAGSLPLLAWARAALAGADDDGAILRRAIELERAAELAYDQLASGAPLGPRLLRLMRQLRSHEREHAEALTRALTDLGGSPPPPPRGPEAVHAVVEGLRDVRSPGAALRFAIELEDALVASYHEAHARLVETPLLQLAASIMAGEGQHLALLRAAAGQDPVPRAFEPREP